MLAQQERRTPVRHGIEGAEMADGFFAGDAADEGDHVVRGHAGGFVDDEETIHGTRRPSCSS